MHTGPRYQWGGVRRGRSGILGEGSVDTPTAAKRRPAPRLRQLVPRPGAYRDRERPRRASGDGHAATCAPSIAIADPDPVRRASAHGQDSPAITRRARRAAPELLGHDGENEGYQREHHQRGHALSVREREQRHQRDGVTRTGTRMTRTNDRGVTLLQATTAQPPPVVRAQRKRRRRRLNHGGPTLPYFPRHRLRDERKERPPQDYRESPTSTTLFSRRNASQETSD